MCDLCDTHLSHYQTADSLEREQHGGMDQDAVTVAPKPVEDQANRNTAVLAFRFPNPLHGPVTAGLILSNRIAQNVGPNNKFC